MLNPRILELMLLRPQRKYNKNVSRISLKMFLSKEKKIGVLLTVSTQAQCACTCRRNLTNSYGKVFNNIICLFLQAGELYLGVEMVKEAIDVYIQGELWPKAKRCAAEMAPK